MNRVAMNNQLFASGQKYTWNFALKQSLHFQIDGVSLCRTTCQHRFFIQCYILITFRRRVPIPTFIVGRSSHAVQVCRRISRPNWPHCEPVHMSFFFVFNAPFAIAGQRMFFNRHSNSGFFHRFCRNLKHPTKLWCVRCIMKGRKCDPIGISGLCQ